MELSLGTPELEIALVLASSCWVEPGGLPGVKAVSEKTPATAVNEVVPLNVRSGYEVRVLSLRVLWLSVTSIFPYVSYKEIVRTLVKFCPGTALKIR